MSDLAKAIVSTIVYFDISDIPLSLKELHLFLYKYRADPEEIREEIDKLSDIIDFREGHYFLKGRDKILEIHRERNELSASKWSWAKRGGRWLQIVPFVRMVGITSSLAINNVKKDSDIDLFIIAQKNRLYTCRVFCFLLLSLFSFVNKLRKFNSHFCLGYFVTDEELDISFKLEEEILNNDLYPLYNISYTLPIFGKETYQNFIEANSWIYKFLPNFSPSLKEQILGSKWIVENRFLRFFRKMLEALLNNCFADFLEEKLAKLQISHELKLIKDKFPDAEYVLDKKMHRVFRHKNTLGKFKESLARYKSIEAKK